MSKKALAFVLAASLMLGLGGCTPDKLDTDDIADKLKQYTISVYAPRSMDEFKDAKAEAVELGIMTEAVAAQYFRAYADELSEADLARSCLAQATYGEPENQSDGVGKYMVSARLYDSPQASPIKITVLFQVNDDGVIDNYSLTVGV